MSSSRKVLSSVLLLAQLIACSTAQRESAQLAEEQTKQLTFENQRQYYGFPLSRAFQANRGAQQFTPVNEETTKEQQFFNGPQSRQESSQDAKQLQEQQNALLLQYAQQQYLNQQAVGRQQQNALLQQQYLQSAAPNKQQQQALPEQQQYKAAEQYPTLLGVRFSAAPTVAKTQFSGNGFSFSY